ncbi:hypothetical protein NDU88_007967 [Pleurodeles waltl]|uniref:Uncharacterized protein n=1 Tax=Pleurodeles waltl TaxID=8319 RepID=A0AAV7QPG5_PLEWA|nr:hypothetical protein NDU88_007967 [Pleurodeles waltl]
MNLETNEFLKVFSTICVSLNPCDGPTLVSDLPYPGGTRSTKLPDPEALGTGANPEVLPGTKGQKRNVASDPGEQEDSEEPVTTGTQTETKAPAVGGEDKDGHVDGTQAGRQRGGEDQEAILQDPGHALGKA